MPSGALPGARGALQGAAAAHHPEPGRPPGQVLLQLWLLRMSAGAIWAGRQDSDQGERNLAFGFSLCVRQEAVGTAKIIEMTTRDLGFNSSYATNELGDFSQVLHLSAPQFPFM